MHADISLKRRSAQTMCFALSIKTTLDSVFEITECVSTISYKEDKNDYRKNIHFLYTDPDDHFDTPVQLRESRIAS